MGEAGLAEPVHGTAQLFSGEATGLIVHLPDWQFPIVIDPLTGVVRYDNFNGHWGDQAHLDRFTQAYAGSTVCAPSRCSLMTGKHNGHAAIRGNKIISVPLAEAVGELKRLDPEVYRVAEVFFG